MLHVWSSICSVVNLKWKTRTMAMTHIEIQRREELLPSVDIHNTIVALYIYAIFLGIF